MTIKLELPDALENELREKATREGLSLDRFILRKLDTKGEHVQDITFTENELIQYINTAEIPEKEWIEFRRLTALRQAEVISPDEYDRLLALVNTIEDKHAERLKYAIELAKMWNVPLETVMKKYGIGPKTA